MPIVFAALSDGVRRARRDSWKPLRWYAGAAPALALRVRLYLCTRYAFRGLVDPATYRASPRAPSAERILSEIPDGATVETDLGLFIKLPHRTRVFFVGNAALVVRELVLIANTARNPAMADPMRYAEILHPRTAYLLVHGLPVGPRPTCWSTAYLLVHAEEGFTLVRRASWAGPPALFSAPGRTASPWPGKPSPRPRGPGSRR